MGKNGSHNLLAVIIMCVVFGPIYLIELLNIRFFAAAKVFDIPVGGFLLWIYYLVVAFAALILVAIINAREKS
jgi:hypothetical protein